MSKRFQFVWWGFEGFAWWRFPWGVRHFEGGLRSIYRYSLCLGPLEIRRWESA